MKALYLIDANSLIHRAFHALPPFTAPDGRPSGALYGLASILLKVLREDKPDYAAALFDRPEPTYREREYAAYKAQRPAAPPPLISQIIEARALFTRFGIPVFEKPGFEADDLIATLAERFQCEPDLRVVILTGDMDTLQLVKDGNVVVRALKKGVSDTALYDERAVTERYGLAPSQLIDYKALVGDPSDNVKGVSGIGPKTAVKLIKEFGSLEAMEEKLGPRWHDAELAKRLVTLDRHADLAVHALEDMRVVPDEGALRASFEALGFKTLVGRINGVVSSNQELF